MTRDSVLIEDSYCPVGLHMYDSQRSRRSYKEAGTTRVMHILAAVTV
jgi:hypothetical protein